MKVMVPRGRLELPTTRIFSAMLYQLSYLGTVPCNTQTRGAYRRNAGACPALR